jgi:hypothetical protein
VMRVMRLIVASESTIQQTTQLSRDGHGEEQNKGDQPPDCQGYARMKAAANYLRFPRALCLTSEKHRLPHAESSRVARRFRMPDGDR